MNYDAFLPYLIFGMVVAAGFVLYQRIPRRGDPEIRRGNDLAALARKLSFHFAQGPDLTFPGRFSFLSWLRQGEIQSASHIFQGQREGYPIVIFDYYFAVNRYDYYWSAYILEMTADFPDTLVSRENFATRILETMGASQIKFESREFSRAFNVRSADKKFAFDVCDAEMMKYLLANRDLIIEIHRGALLLLFEDWLRPEKLESNLSRLIEVRKLLPEYLFAKK